MATIQNMERDGISALAKHEQIFVKQTKKGCVQELMGCEANNEFNIFPSKEQLDSQIMYSLEDTSCPMRFCCNNNRAFDQTIWVGTKDSHNDVVMKMHRPLACALQPCCCSSKPWMQTIDFMKSDDTSIGGVEIPFFCCIPNLKVKDAAGNVEYQVQFPSCMGGMCVDCMAEGLCNCKIPLYIYAPDAQPVNGAQVGKIVKLWRGLGTEVFTDATSFQVEFPPNSSDETKARLLGTTMFVNMLFFEKGDQ